MKKLQPFIFWLFENFLSAKYPIVPMTAAKGQTTYGVYVRTT